MVRIVVRTQDCNAATQIEGGRAEIRYRTFDLDAPELEAHLRHGDAYTTVEVVGAHLVPPEMVKF